MNQAESGNHIQGDAILNMENISKPLENMNIKLFDDITVFLLNRQKRYTQSHKVITLCTVSSEFTLFSEIWES